MGGATGGCGGSMSPPLLGPAGYRRVQGAVQWKWSLLLQQTVFIQYCTSDWISTPLTLVDTCQVNDIWKDGLGRVSTVHPQWTAALLKSTCQHAHAAVNWLSMSLSRHTYQISLASSYFPACSSLIRFCLDCYFDLRIYLLIFYHFKLIYNGFFMCLCLGKKSSK